MRMGKHHIERIAEIGPSIIQSIAAMQPLLLEIVLAE
jgi:hypothetical protein